MPGLTLEQVQQFLEEGYLWLPSALAPKDLTPLIQEFESVVDQSARQLYAEGKISSLYEDKGFNTRLAWISRESEAAFRSLFSGIHTGPALFHLLVHPQLLNIAESLVGPEILCHPAYRVRPKLPEHNLTLVPWHQDAGYMEPECDAVLQVTFWIPLVPATVENGCLQVIPRSHLGGVLRHRRIRGRFYLEIPEEELPPIEPVTVEMDVGDILLIHNLTAHRSLPNRSNEVRWSVDIRYQDARLPSGYAPEAGFLARSRERPEEVLTRWEDFERLRKTYQPGPAPQRWPLEEEGMAQ